MTLTTGWVSIAATQRGRFFWAAWWTGEPVTSPFRRPDASNGGAGSVDAAREEAERVAGRALVLVDARWAQAVMRTLRGRAAFSESEARRVREGVRRERAPTRAPSEEGGSIWQTLGLSPSAGVADVKQAYRRKALETHPDRGGDEEAFRAVHEAYEVALVRAERRATRPKRRAK